MLKLECKVKEGLGMEDIKEILKKISSIKVDGKLIYKK